MTESKLNNAILKKVLWKIRGTKTVTFDEKQNCFWRESIGFSSYPVIDYCNNWNELMPLVVEHDTKVFGHIDITRCWEPRHLAECLLKVLTADAEAP